VKIYLINKAGRGISDIFSEFTAIMRYLAGFSMVDLIIINLLKLRFFLYFENEKYFFAQIFVMYRISVFKKKIFGHSEMGPYFLCFFSVRITISSVWFDLHVIRHHLQLGVKNQSTEHPPMSLFKPLRSIFGTCQVFFFSPFFFYFSIVWFPLQSNQ